MPWSPRAHSTEASSRAEEIFNGGIDDPLVFEVRAKRCGWTPVFTMTSPSHRWPRRGGIYAHQADSRNMVKKRRLKLDIAKQANFNVDKRVVALAGDVGSKSGYYRLGRTFTCNIPQR